MTDDLFDSERWKEWTRIEFEVDQEKDAADRAHQDMLYRIALRTLEGKEKKRSNATNPWVSEDDGRAY